MNLVALPVLIEALKHKDPVAREMAARALGSVGREIKQAAAALRAALRDDEPAVRVAAARALWFRERKLDDLLPVFQQGLKDKKAVIRGRVMEAIMDIALNLETGVLPLVVDALNDSEATIRDKAIDILCQSDAISELGQALTHKESSVRVAAAEALSRIGPDAHGAARQLGEAALDKDPRVRTAVRAALHSIRSEDADRIIDRLEEIERMQK